MKPVLFAREKIEPQPSDDLTLHDDIVKAFLEQLSLSVKRRVTQVYEKDGSKKARIGILFSGGIDSVIITALTHLHIAPEEEIELMNVSFGSGQAIDRKQSIIAHEELW